MATRMQQRRGTAAQWISTNSGNGPILAAGEIGFESDTNKFKIGDGVNHWVDLTYFTDAAELSNIIDGAPALLDTLNELAAAIGDDPTFITTVATNLSDHQSDTTNIHGIADTSALATKTYADSAVSTHSSDTTSVHGITDTAELATKTFAAELLTNATKSNITITGDKNGLTISAENGVADSTTDNLTEGSTNKYFTDERAQDAVGNAVGNGLKYTDASGAIEPDLALSGGLYIDNSDKLAVDGYYVTFNSAEQTLVNKTLTSPKINEAVELTATSTELNTLDGITASTAELNTLDGITASTAELNTLDGITASTAELNILDGATLSTTELNYVDGVTSAIQTQLDAKAPLNAPTFTGTVTSTNDLVVDGDLTVNGTNFAASATSITIEDNLVQIAHNNPANTVDLGLVVGYNDGTAKHAGLVKDTSANTWKLFKGVTTEPATTVDFTEGSLDDLQVGALTASSMSIGVDAVATESYVDGAVSGAEVDQSTLAGTGINWNAVDSQFEVDTTLIQARVTDVTDTEIGYLNGVTSGIQNQLDDKAPLASPTFSGTLTVPGQQGSTTINGMSVATEQVEATTIMLNSVNLADTLAGKASLSGATFDGDVYIGDGPTNTPDIHVYGSELFYSPIGASASISALDPAGPGPGILFLNGDVTIGQSGTGALTAGAATFKGDVILGDGSAGGNDVTITKGLIANYSTGTSGQVLKSTGTGVEWGTVSGYEAPTLGSTSIASGSTVTTIAGLTLSNPVLGVSGTSNLMVAFENVFSAPYAYTSTNGTTWTARAFPTAVDKLYSSAFGNPGIVALPSRNNATWGVRSTDGITWTNITTPAIAYTNFVSWVNDQFIATAGYTTSYIASTDGITWTSRTFPASIYASVPLYGNNTYAMIGENGSSPVYTSTDGTSWTARTAPHGWYNDAIFANGLFVAVKNGDGATSTDGITWTAFTFPEDVTMGGSTPMSYLGYGNGKYIAVRSGYTEAAYSTDAVTWSLTTLPSAGSWRKPAFTNGVFVTNANGGDFSATSTDGITWTYNTLSSPFENPSYVSGLSAGSVNVLTSGTLSIAGSTGTSGQVLASTGTGVEWVTPAQGAAFSELMLIGA